MARVVRAEFLRGRNFEYIKAARALGLDCGPMGGIDPAKMDAAFFADTTIKSHMICALGQADPARQRARNPRLTFDEACRLL